MRSPVQSPFVPPPAAIPARPTGCRHAMASFMTEAPQSKPRRPSGVRRSGTQRRQRSRVWQIALSETEDVEARGKAAAAGLSRSSYGRAALLGSPGIRARRTPTVNAAVLAQAVAALNRAGNNLNQIARVLNSAQAAGASEALQTLYETRAAVLQIMALTGRRDGA